MNLPIRVAGIPCQANILSYYPASSGQFFGPPELCYPAEPAELEWEVLDRRGRPAPWLERKLTATKRDQLIIELIERINRDRVEAAAEAEWERRYG